MESCNFINNEITDEKSGNEDFGTIKLAGTLIIQNSCIYGNNAGGFQFQCSSRASVTLKGCYVDSILCKKPEKVIVESEKIAAFDLHLDYLKDPLCYEDVIPDQKGTITFNAKPKIRAFLELFIVPLFICSY